MIVGTFQFQKVRLWDCRAMIVAEKLNNFNSKRCDYEKRKQTQLHSFLCDFNSKRCDYEEYKNGLCKHHYDISIPKGAIMRIMQCKFIKAYYYFNSKRCDYELVEPLFDFVLRHIFQFQKVRLWVSIIGHHIEPILQFQFQKVRLWG